MQLLADGPLFPPVLLLPAKSIPVSSSLSGSPLLAACWTEFHFDAINQILYLSEAQLGHVGNFLATLLQSMAYITSGNQTHANRVLANSKTRASLKRAKCVIFFQNTIAVSLLNQDLSRSSLWMLSARLSRRSASSCSTFRSIGAGQRCTSPSPIILRPHAHR